MAYLSTDADGLGEFGCGADCSCKRCRNIAASSLSEVYEKEEIAPPARAKPPATPKMGGFAERPGGPVKARGQVPASTSGPVFRFECAAGCTPLAVDRCRGALRQAIIDARQLSLHAAAKLEAKPRNPVATHLFRSVFGHEPSQPFPWACTGASGDFVACQFRIVAEALRRGGTLYRCDPCKGEYPTTAVVDVNAIALACRNEVLLCPPFWRLSPQLRAGVIVHEMFHLQFPPFFNHCSSERKGTSAYCFEAFALRLAGHAPDPLVVSECLARPL